MKCASRIVIKLICLREDAASTIQAFGGHIFQGYNSAYNFLHISVRKVFSSYVCGN